MPDPVKIERFAYLLSEVEVGARSILDGRAPDIMFALSRIGLDLGEATKLAAEVSIEVLDQLLDEPA